MNHLYSELHKLTAALAEGDESAMTELDRHGLFAAPGEECRDTAKRISKWLDANMDMCRTIKNGHTVSLDPGIDVARADLLPESVKEPAEEKTLALYGFAVDWAPGFFLRSGVGLLWGGCAWHDYEKEITVFALRDSFRTGTRYLVYDRDELIAHESCHAARSAFGNDWPLEEFFAYRTARSPFRRYMGNCFILKCDALIFMAPAFLLLFQQLLRLFCFPALPWWPAWTVLIAVAGYLLGRNQLARNKFFKARQKLVKYYSLSAANAESFLFRCTWQEISAVAAMAKKELCDKYLLNNCDLRRRTAIRRFIPELMEV